MAILRRAAYRGRDVLFTAVANTIWRRQVLGTVRCLLYHRVGVRGSYSFLDQYGAESIGTGSLRRDLSFLQHQGAVFLTFSDLRAGMFPGPGQFGIIVSFDDGTRDVYEHGLPVLEALGVRGVVFQISGLVGTRKLLWEHLLYWLWETPSRRQLLLCRLQETDAFSPFEPSSLTIDGLRLTPHVAALGDAMERALTPEMRLKLATLAERLYPSAGQLRSAACKGHEIGSHGHNHYPRLSLGTAQFEQELSESKIELETILGRSVSIYSHPYNSYDQRDPTLLGRYFNQVATVDSAPILRDTDPMGMPRYNWPGEFRNRLRWRRWLWTGE